VFFGVGDGAHQAREVARPCDGDLRPTLSRLSVPGDGDRLAASGPVARDRGLPLRGFFLWKPLADRRLPDPRDGARHDLAGQIQTVRAAGTEAWIGTRDGLVSGWIVVSGTRPE
jgi:hypothetical protein